MALVRLIVLTTFALSPFARAEPQQDMLFFTSVEGADMYAASDPALEDTDIHAKVDFLYSYNSDRFRFLAEYILSDEESELERLQAAWKIDNKTRLWFGRFHAISKYWTSEFHHGQFMQTSISRPAMDAWEDESGPSPSHITGVWLDHEHSVGQQSAISFGLAAGLAPKFAGQQLRPLDILSPDSGHDLAISARLIYRPDVLSNNQIGMIFARDDISVVSDSAPNLADLSAIRLRNIGVFANWSWQDWRLSTNWTYFDIDMHYNSGDVPENFLMGYLQAEYQVTENWTIFGRTEQADKEDNSVYLQLLPEVIAHRGMLGVRWDFADSQALTLEAAATSIQGDNFEHEDFDELRLQWSAVFP